MPKHNYTNWIVSAFKTSELVKMFVDKVIEPAVFYLRFLEMYLIWIRMMNTGMICTIFSAEGFGFDPCWAHIWSRIVFGCTQLGTLYTKSNFVQKTQSEPPKLEQRLGIHFIL